MPRRAPPASNTPWAAVHAQGLRDHRLLLQHCASCGFVRMPPGPVCPQCWSEDFRWEAHSGAGHVTSFVWYMRPLHPRFPEVPYNVALVQLDGPVPVVVASVADAHPDTLRVGDRVHACYGDADDGASVLLFQNQVEGAP